MIFRPSHPVLQILGNLCILWIILIGVIGAWLGIRLARGKLTFACPFCDHQSQVAGGIKQDILIACPTCGPVRVTSRPFRASIATKLDDIAES